MAYVGHDIIHASNYHNSLTDSMDYVTDKKNNYKKTQKNQNQSEFDKLFNDIVDDEKYIYCSGCISDFAEEQWMHTIKQSPHHGAKYGKGKEEVLAYHIWQSFKPGEVTAEQAHEIGKEYAAKLFGDKYQYIVTTHLDKAYKDHYHNHILFCSVDTVEHKKYKYVPPKCPNASIDYWRKVSDEICKAHGLNIINDNYIDNDPAIDGNTNRNTERKTEYKKYKNTKYRDKENYKKKNTYNREQLRSDIDKVLQKADSYEEFLNEMVKLGYEVKAGGSYTAFKHKDWKRFARLNKTLGDDYTEEAIKERIITKRPHIPKRMRKRRIRLIIDIETNIKCQASEGYTNWAKIHNLQEASKTLNFLIENDVGSYEEMDKKVADLKAEKEKSAKDLQQMSKDIHDIKERMALIKNYNSLKKYAVEYNSSSNKAKYRREHAAEIEQYKAISETLRKLYPDGKIPSEKKLEKELDDLLKQREELYNKYVNMDEDIENFAAAKDNIDRFMHRNQEQPERDTAEQAHTQSDPSYTVPHRKNDQSL